MGEPIRVLFITAAGPIETQFTEAEAAALPSMRGVISPAEGRPRLAAAVVFHIQQELASDSTSITIMDTSGKITLMRSDHVYGACIDEVIDVSRERAPLTGGMEYDSKAVH